MGMKVNHKALEHAKKLIGEGKVVTGSDWSESQPDTGAENKFQNEHGWDGYAEWYLAIDQDAGKETKDRYNFPYGDFKKVHRSGVIAAKQRAGQYDYTDIEKAADELLDQIDQREDE